MTRAADRALVSLARRRVWGILERMLPIHGYLQSDLSRSISARLERPGDFEGVRLSPALQFAPPGRGFHSRGTFR